MKLSSAVDRIAESATTRITRRAAELRQQGVEVVNLGVGEPDFSSPAMAIEGARRALAEGWTRYTPTDGLPSLRRALAQDLARRAGAPWEEESVIVTCGAKAALMELALALFEAGDEVVVSSPCWVSFPQQIRFAGARPVPVPTIAEEAFRLRAEPLLAAITERTRAVLVNAPCNPTGGLLAADELARLVTGCAERGVLLIADETYERYVYDESFTSAASLAGEAPDTVVVVGSFSKTYAMTGWRLGYLAGPAAVVAAVSRLQSHFSGNPTTFAMVGALEALAEPESQIAARRAEFRRRRELVMARLATLPGFACRPPGGAFYVFPRVDDLFGEGIADSSALAEHLLEEGRVAVVPGLAFGDDRHLRISYACSEADLREGLDRIATALAAVA
ncbi:MAG: pyridoxal phosphate-dependent aminotransferase [Acidobacteriota bacterium]